MTFVERYQVADTWIDKVIVMRLFHTIMSNSDKTWTLKKTAISFGVSIGLVSENIRLATALDSDKLANCNTRQEALTKLNRQK